MSNINSKLKRLNEITNAHFDDGLAHSDRMSTATEHLNRAVEAAKDCDVSTLVNSISQAKDASNYLQFCLASSPDGKEYGELVKGIINDIESLTSNCECKRKENPLKDAGSCTKCLKK